MDCRLMVMPCHVKVRRKTARWQEQKMLFSKVAETTRVLGNWQNGEISWRFHCIWHVGRGVFLHLFVRVFGATFLCSTCFAFNELSEIMLTWWSWKVSGRSRGYRRSAVLGGPNLASRLWVFQGFSQSLHFFALRLLVQGFVNFSC